MTSPALTTGRAAAPGCDGQPPARTPAGVRVDIVVPVHNEQGALPGSIRRLHDFLTAELPFGWRIVIVDNASTDRTVQIAQALAADLPGVTLTHLERKGRGRALRAAWSASYADVLAYMDVDLSTDLRALLPLLAPLVSGHSDIAIGSRLARSANVVRGPKREIISRSYNWILRLSLNAGFSDAQCGFKAIRGDVARELLPMVRDEAWFFDTELLVQAERRGLRIHEVPVDWVDDPDSRVDIVRTALDDLRGVARLLAERSVVRFAAVGGLCTLAYAVLYLLLHGLAGPAGSNAIALTLTALGNTQANRRFTFGIRGRPGLVREHLMGGAVFVLTLLLTTAALALLHGLAAHPSRLLELTVLVASSVCATVTRYVALRWWVFAGGQRTGAARHRPALSPTVAE